MSEGLGGWEEIATEEDEGMIVRREWVVKKITMYLTVA